GLTSRCDGGRLRSYLLARQVTFCVAERRKGESQGNEKTEHTDHSIDQRHILRLLNRESTSERAKRNSRPGQYRGDTYDAAQHVIGNDRLAQAARVNIKQDAKSRHQRP